MKISDLRDDQIKVGLKLRSLADPNIIGTVVQIKYPPEDRYQWAVVIWSNGKESGFWENQCKCEVVYLPE